MDNVLNSCKREADVSGNEDCISISATEFDATGRRLGRRGWDLSIDIRSTEAEYEDLSLINELNQRTDGRFYLDAGRVVFSIFVGSSENDDEVRHKLATLKIEAERFMKKSAESKTNWMYRMYR